MKHYFQSASRWQRWKDRFPGVNHSGAAHFLRQVTGTTSHTLHLVQSEISRFFIEYDASSRILLAPSVLNAAFDRLSEKLAEIGVSEDERIFNTHDLSLPMQFGEWNSFHEAKTRAHLVQARMAADLIRFSASNDIPLKERIFEGIKEHLAAAGEHP